MFQIATKYGVLKIPVEDIRKVEFGFRYPEGVEKKIQDAIVLLGSNNFRARENASAELLEFGEYAVPALEQASKSSDNEVAERARKLLKTITENVPPEKFAFEEMDTIHTKDSSLVGRIEGTVLTGQNPNFGELKVKLSSVRSVVFINAPRMQKYKLDAAVYNQNNNNWSETEIEVKNDTALDIVIDGKVNLKPTTGGYMVDADGMNGRGSGTSGTVWGKIGLNGPMFIIGKRYHANPRQVGKLYLIITPSQWDATSGAFNVKITAMSGTVKNPTTATPPTDPTMSPEGPQPMPANPPVSR
jgi:hypothetical protein